LLSTWRKGPPGQTPLPSPPAKVEPLGEARPLIRRRAGGSCPWSLPRSASSRRQR
jgi:hypothetical protein